MEDSECFLSCLSSPRDWILLCFINYHFTPKTGTLPLLAPPPRRVWLVYQYRQRTMWSLTLTIHPLTRVLGAPRNLYSPHRAPCQSRSLFAPFIGLTHSTALLRRCPRGSPLSSPQPSLSLPLQLVLALFLSLTSHYRGHNMPIS